MIITEQTDVETQKQLNSFKVVLFRSETLINTNFFN
ncbi:UNVERIFIED_ORG: hypothetical protein J2W82_004287 [Pseudomonas mohnii]|nr:hypothetical protein [Pseudomonas mohnii]